MGTPIPIFNAGSIGVVKDFSDHTLPPEAWTDANNVRFVDQKAIRTPGYVKSFGTPVVPPTFLLPVEFQGSAFWVYPEAKASGGTVRVVTNIGDTDITRASGGYSSANTFDWNGFVFQGTPILATPNEVPQFWQTIDSNVKLADLPAWPSTLRAKMFSSYKNYIVAMNLTENGVAAPHRIRWSDGADPGTVPESWDVTDPTFDAGELDLSDTNSGEIVTGLPFQGFFTIYKRDSTWMMRYIGGQLIMSIEPTLGTSGCLCTRSVCNLTLPNQNIDVHFVMNGYDVGIFKGSGFESVVHQKLLRQINAEIDPINFAHSFCFNNPTKEEAVFAYPSSGSVVPNRAFIWNYRDNTTVLRDWFGYYATGGTIDTSQTDTWAQQELSWANMGIRTWRSSKRRQILVANNQLPRFFNLDIGDTADGVPFSSSIERTGLAVIGLDRNNQPKVDFERRKILTRLWPKVRGGRVNVFAGAAESFDGPYTFSGPQLFDPTDPFPFVDFDEPPEGRLLAVRFEGVNNEPWVMDGYSVEVEETSNI